MMRGEGPEEADPPAAGAGGTAVSAPSVGARDAPGSAASGRGEPARALGIAISCSSPGLPSSQVGEQRGCSGAALLPLPSAGALPEGAQPARHCHKERLDREDGWN